MQRESDGAEYVWWPSNCLHNLLILYIAIYVRIMLQVKDHSAPPSVLVKLESTKQPLFFFFFLNNTSNIRMNRNYKNQSRKLEIKIYHTGKQFLVQSGKHLCQCSNQLSFSTHICMYMCTYECVCVFTHTQLPFTVVHLLTSSFPASLSQIPLQNWQAHELSGTSAGRMRVHAHPRHHCLQTVKRAVYIIT